MNVARLPFPRLAVSLIALLPFWLGVSTAFSAPALEVARISIAAVTATPTVSPSPTTTAAPARTPTVTPTPLSVEVATPFTVYIPPLSDVATATPTQTPTLSPEEAFNASFAPSRGSKLSLHFVRGSPATYEFLKAARPPFVKLVDAALDWSPDLRKEFPGMMQIGRVTAVEDDSLIWKNPITAANDYVAKTLQYYRKFPDVDYWEGWNEWTAANPHDPRAWQVFAQFEAQRACLLQSYGYRAVIGNFSAGRPEYSEMLIFLPAIRIGLKCGAILGLHEYSAPTMQYGFGAGIPHRPAYPDRGALTLRYRYWYEDLFKPLALPMPLVITELGVDGGVEAGRPGPRGVLGWRDFAPYWKDTGLGENPARVYMSQLAWYDSEIRQDPYVLGAAIYQAGSYGSDSFEVETLIPELTNYVVGMQGR